MGEFEKIDSPQLNGGSPQGDPSTWLGTDFVHFVAVSLFARLGLGSWAAAAVFVAASKHVLSAVEGDVARTTREFAGKVGSSAKGMTQPGGPKRSPG